MKELQPSNGIRAYIPMVIFGFISFFFYQILIFLYPSVYWYDSHIRLALRDQVLIGHWLPLVQFLIVVISNFSRSLIVLRSFLAFLAVVVSISMFFLAKRLFSSTTALIAMMFLAVNTMFVALAIVPYPDVIFVGLIFASLVLLDEPIFSRRFYFGVLAINLACLTRYEGWILSAIFIFEISLKLLARLKWTNAIWPMIKAVLLLIVGPLIWLFFGFSDSGTMLDRLKNIIAFEVMTTAPQLQNHLLSRLNFQHVLQFSGQFFYLLIWQFHPELLILSAIGLLAVFFNSASNLPHIRILVFLLLDWILLAFVQPWKFGNLRQPFVFQVLLTLYAAYGLEQSLWWLFHRLSFLVKQEDIPQRIIPVIMIVSLILSARLALSSYKFVAETSREVDFYIPFKIANWLNLRLKEGDAILIVDGMDDYYPYNFAAYIKYPFDDVLDNRLDSWFGLEKLKAPQMIYIVEFYKSQDLLSAVEHRILDDLEDNYIQGEPFVVNEVNIWYVPANQLPVSP